MKTSSILALAATLALGVSLSAQTSQSTDTTTPDSGSSMIASSKKPARTTKQNTSDPAATNSTSQFSDSTEANQPVDYSKNPYWAPRDWNYIEENATGGN
jgi:hypothetical protein